MQNATSVEIDRPIDEVFRLTNEHIAEWSIIVVEDEVLDDKDGGVGTTFRTVTEEHGKRMEFQGVITRHDPPHANAVRLTGDSFDIETEFTFEDLSGRTRVTQTASVTGKGFFKWFMLLFGWMMNKSHCKASENELESLKKFCETHRFRRLVMHRVHSRTSSAYEPVRLWPNRDEEMFREYHWSYLQTHGQFVSEAVECDMGVVRY